MSPTGRPAGAAAVALPVAGPLRHPGVAEPREQLALPFLDAPGVPHLEVIDGRIIRRRRLWVGLIATLSVLTVFFLLLGLAAFQTLLAQGQARLDGLDRTTAEARTRNETLRLQVAQLESPERVLQAAQERLGMVPPAAVTYVMPSAETAAEVARAASDAAPAPDGSP